MTRDRFKEVRRQILTLFEGRERSAAWQQVQLLAEGQRDADTARAILSVLDDHPPDVAFGILLLESMFERYEDDDMLVAAIADQIEHGRDVDLLNDAPPASELFEKLVVRLSAMRVAASGDAREMVLAALAHTARLMGRQRDAIAESCYRRLVALKPGEAHNHYNLGLFLKTRGRFAEGVEANQTALRLEKEPSEAHRWNLGICATGAGHSDVALGIWKQMGQKIEIGRFGLPDGRYPACKVRLAERPLAERDSDHDDPGIEETIWIERLSPCHGIIRSVLYQDLGIDYGDVVLIDGAPITHHRYGDDQIPVFPHLTTLIRRHYQLFDFAGVQTEEGQLSAISRELERDAVVYPHTEQFQVLCASCWRDSGIDHDHRDELTKHVVRGRIAVPPDMPAVHVIEQIEAAIAARPGCELYAPELCRVAGRTARLDEERQKFGLLTANGAEQ